MCYSCALARIGTWTWLIAFGACLHVSCMNAGVDRSVRVPDRRCVPYPDCHLKRERRLHLNVAASPHSPAARPIYLLQLTSLCFLPSIS